MFSAPSHAVKGKGFDLEEICCCCVGRRRFESGPVFSDMVQWRMWRPWKKKTDFLVVKMYVFLPVGGMEGQLFASICLNVMDQTYLKINTLSLKHTLCHSPYGTWSNSFHRVCICEEEHTHTHTQEQSELPPCSLCSNTPPPLTLTKF